MLLRTRNTLWAHCFFHDSDLYGLYRIVLAMITSSFRFVRSTIQLSELHQFLKIELMIKCRQLVR